MELKEAMQRRRSIRIYKEDKIAQDVVEAIISDSKNAPSWKNSQTPRYIVAMSDEAREKVLESLPDGNRAKVEKAPVLIVCTFKKNRAGFMRDGTPDNEAGNGWGYYDSGMAHMCLLLAAAERGIGSLVMGIRDAETLIKNFHIGDDELVTSVIALGYQDINPSQPLRKETKDIVTFM